MDRAIVMETMRAYIAENLKDCCAEMIEWHNTTVLPEGKIRCAAKMIKDVKTLYPRASVVAEIKFQAMKKVADES